MEQKFRNVKLGGVIYQDYLVLPLLSYWLLSRL